ncbi:hypothetical protein [Actinophytocola oryzae]|uniref:hypothetical protein n=1 Tax=Actinophytocola oryzae TaxID=502181 RepID=UPI00141502B6|nr:hypothetical protein [Actinophytocola oryzae]
MPALLASCRDEVPPTSGPRAPDAACELGHAIGRGVGTSVGVAISTSVAMGGSHSAIAVRGA